MELYTCGDKGLGCQMSSRKSVRSKVYKSWSGSGHALVLLKRLSSPDRILLSADLKRSKTDPRDLAHSDLVGVVHFGVGFLAVIEFRLVAVLVYRRHAVLLFPDRATLP